MRNDFKVCRYFLQRISQFRLIAIMVAPLILPSIAPAQALICEKSHFAIAENDVRTVAHKLAVFRFQIYQMAPSNGAKLRAHQEFQSKYQEYETFIGDPEKARELFQTEMAHVQDSKHFEQNLDGKQKRQKEKEQREKEDEAIDPASKLRKMEFREIQPGSFLMGEIEKKETEITKPYAMMATPVTQWMWARLKIAMGEQDLKKINPSYNKDGPEQTSLQVENFYFQLLPDHPVENISFEEVLQFIEGLNQLSQSADLKIQKLLSQLIPGHQKGDVYDLPTEAQWEFVARNRGQSNGKYFDRDDDQELIRYAWYDGGRGSSTQAVATLEPRLIDGQPFYDLEGNIWEWTRDSFDGTKMLLGGRDPLQTGGSRRILRGGGNGDPARFLTTGASISSTANSRGAAMGFRLIRTRP